MNSILCSSPGCSGEYVTKIIDTKPSNEYLPSHNITRTECNVCGDNYYDRVREQIKNQGH